MECGNVCQHLHSIVGFIALFLKSALYYYISMKKYSKLHPEPNSALHSCETIIWTPGRQLMNQNKSRICPKKKKKKRQLKLCHMVDKYSFSQNIYVLHVLEIVLGQGIAYNHLFPSL